MDFFIKAVAECVDPDNTLRKVHALMDWQLLAVCTIVPVLSCLKRTSCDVDPRIQIPLSGQ